MFNKRKKQREQIIEIEEDENKHVDQVKKDASEYCMESDKKVENMAMKMRQYDELMGMDYGEDYIDPVTGKVNPYVEFKRNRDIYSEHLKDTGSLFDTD